MHQDIEKLLDIAKEKGSITEKQREIILNKAQQLGEDVSEVEFILEDIPLKKDMVEKTKRCPHCGNMMAGNELKCPDCGYEFQNIEANKSIKELFALLNEIDGNNSQSEMISSLTGGDIKRLRKKKTIIENFPIPNTKENLVEFITSLQPKAIDTSDKLALSYYKKYEECINKAKTLYPNDSVFAPILMEFENVKKVAKKTIRFKKLFSLKSGCLLYIALYIVFMIAFGIWALISNNRKSSENEVRENKFVELVNSGNIDEAKNIAKTDDNRKTIYDYYIANKDWNNAEKYAINNSWSERRNCQAYYEYMKTVVETLCEDGKKDEAIRFINTKVVYYMDYDNEDNAMHKHWNTNLVTKKLNHIVNNN